MQTSFMKYVHVMKWVWYFLCECIRIPTEANTGESRDSRLNYWSPELNNFDYINVDKVWWGIRRHPTQKAQQCL